MTLDFNFNPLNYGFLKFMGVVTQDTANTIKCPKGMKVIAVPIDSTKVEAFIALPAAIKDPLSYKDINNKKWKK